MKGSRESREGKKSLLMPLHIVNAMLLGHFEQSLTPSASEHQLVELVLSADGLDLNFSFKMTREMNGTGITVSLKITVFLSYQ